MFNAFEKGALIFNYLGHGGEDGLAAERIWEKSDGQNLNNQYKYPCLTITCEFHVLIILLGPQQANLLESKGGAIAMLTTREISQFNGEIFNDRLNASLLSYNSNQYTSIAEACELLKQQPKLLH
jgi:hypothetical protein